jgi:DNA-binding NarL/FixJ family response regulator
MRVVLAEDSVLLRAGISRLLAEASLDVVAEVEDAEALLEAVARLQPDVVITDIKMPPTFGDEGLRAAEEIRRRWPDIGVLVVSQYVEPRYAVTLMHSGGGTGYLLKERIARADDLLDAVRRVAEGRSVVDPEVVAVLMSRASTREALAPLSPREREVLELMAQGRSNAAICAALFLSPKTVETHVGAVFTKLGLLPGPDDHRRVLAVVTYLRGSSSR